MSDTGLAEQQVETETLTGFDLWTPNDYSNFITISAAAIGSTLLVIFKSRCKNISLCWGLIGCIREVQEDSEGEDEENNNNNNNPPQGVAQQGQPQEPIVPQNP
tara:strand:+ start:1728 stop:2039 length:312 start_codon:yes stop_codon:yes gene_type:complete